MLSTANIEAQINDCRNGMEYCKERIETGKLDRWEILEYNGVIKSHIDKLAELLPRLELVKYMMWEDTKLTEAFAKSEAKHVK